MVRLQPFFLFIFISSFFFISSLSAKERVLYVYNWSDFFDTSVLDDFSKETGIKVVYDVFDSNEILETKLLLGKSGYDVVVPSGNFLARQIKAGVFAKIDKTKLPNLSFLWDVITKKTQTCDPGNQYSVNYMWGTTGIGYNIKKIQEVLRMTSIDSLDVVFKKENIKKLKACGVYMLDEASDIIPLTLNYLGLNPNSVEKNDLAQAQKILMDIRPYIQKFSSSQYVNALANGDICLAVGWSGDILQARNRAKEANQGVELAYVIPKEGTEIWFDQLAIPADAANKEEAHIFINYLMRPDIIARISNHIYYPNGNKGSWPFIKKEIIEDRVIYPNEDTFDHFYTVKFLGLKEKRAMSLLWTKITTGR